jgi:hypothetical protein
VATPAVPTPPAEVQQRMCEAVVEPTRPEKVTSTIMVCATASMVTTANPVAGDAFGGDSAGSLRLPA